MQAFKSLAISPGLDPILVPDPCIPILVAISPGLDPILVSVPARTHAISDSTRSSRGDANTQSVCRWGLAMGALKDDAGGWLHVHENVSEADEAAWLVRLQVV